MPEFMEEFPETPRLAGAPETPATDWDRAIEYLAPDDSVPPVEGVEPGPAAAEKALHAWVSGGIRGYAEKGNDPVSNGTSGLSPYLHFGQLSPQRAALAVSRCDCPSEDAEAFLEQLVVRRELSDNFCLYNEHYDSPKGWPDWAAETLDEHRGDEREHLYSYEEFKAAKTHSALWNAAQMQVVRSGFMHGYMRMFWAKKILEWSGSPETALDVAVRLNDRYQLDGRDPNGCVGCMWSIGGVHDRGWKERPVLGKIRYMNERGCRRKFDVDEYVRRWLWQAV
jgi:deoxyribodipyrimidine photo-lyase